MCSSDLNVIDLQGETMNSLASVVADTLGYALDKRCQRSNWDFRPLSEQQKCYAGLDAEVLLEVAARLGMVALQSSSSLRDDAHLYSSDALLFRDGTPRFGVDLNATDVNLFTEDACRFGANLWESDELLYTTAERVAEDRKNATLRDLEERVYVNEDSTVDRDCPVCLGEIGMSIGTVKKTDRVGDGDVPKMENAVLCGCLKTQFRSMTCSL